MSSDQEQMFSKVWGNLRYKRCDFLHLQGDYETAASLYKRSTEIKESTTVSGQVTPRRSSTYDPPHLKNMPPPPTMFYTQHD